MFQFLEKRLVSLFFLSCLGGVHAGHLGGWVGTGVMGLRAKVREGGRGLAKVMVYPR